VAAGVISSGLIGAVLVWFGSINLLLAGFNLLPAFPLDGGRIYQAWLWKGGLTQDEATGKAARLGGGIGQVMVWVGVVEILFAGLLGGLWLMALGWFIREASIAEAQGVRRESALRRFTTADVMTPEPVSVPESRSIERFVEDVLSSGRHAAYPVRDETQNVVGLVELKSVRSTPRSEWPTTTVGAVMKPLSDTPVAAPDDTVDVLARGMEEREATRALVMDGDVLVGIVSPSDIVRLTLAMELAEGTDLAPSGR
jgi:CBS domain-containing protein